jgi:hypothetical protein
VLERYPRRCHTMHMGVVLEVLPPGVEDCQKADFSPEVSGISGDVQQGLRGGPKQQVVDNPRVLQGERAESRWQGENDMEIPTGSSSAARASTHHAASVAWHFGQWRLRHEL